MSCENPTWNTNRWGSRESDVWPEEFPRPRSCSFCGSVHPEDLLKLVELGWELEMSTKAYKSYWNPPGYAERMDEVLADFTTLMDPNRPAPKYPSPVPPVKLYSEHVDAGFVAKVNTQLAINRQRVLSAKKEEGK